MLAILLVVPLGIHISFRAELLTANQRIRHITWRLWICCSLPAAIATSSMLLFYPANKEDLAYRAASWIGGVSWFVFTLWIFVLGGASLWHFITTLLKNKTTQQRVPWERLPVAGGWLFIAVGGLWFTSLIVGKSPLDYDLRFIMLTALHFSFCWLCFTSPDRSVNSLFPKKQTSSNKIADNHLPDFVSQHSVCRNRYCRLTNH